jgi:hypothetical protein
VGQERPAARRPLRWRELCAAAGLFAIASLVSTWPLALHPTRTLPSDLLDTLRHLPDSGARVGRAGLEVRPDAVRELWVDNRRWVAAVLLAHAAAGGAKVPHAIWKLLTAAAAPTMAATVATIAQIRRSSRGRARAWEFMRIPALTGAHCRAVNPRCFRHSRLRLAAGAGGH